MTGGVGRRLMIRPEPMPVTHAGSRVSTSARVSPSVRHDPPRRDRRRSTTRVLDPFLDPIGRTMAIGGVLTPLCFGWSRTLRTSADWPALYGMEEVRGSIPLSSTQNRRSAACRGSVGVASVLVNVANWLRWLRRDVCGPGTCFVRSRLQADAPTRRRAGPTRPPTPRRGRRFWRSRRLEFRPIVTQVPTRLGTCSKD